MITFETAWEPVRAALEASCAEARRQVTGDLNQIFRRLRHYEHEDHWIGALRDGASHYASTFGIFVHRNGALRLRAQRNLNVPEQLEFTVTPASAFAAAVESREPVVALCTPGEIGEALQREQPSPRAHLFPLANGGRVVAMLFAVEEQEFNGSALELLAGMAAAVLERQANQALYPQIGPSVKQEVRPDTRQLPAWTDLDALQRGLHIRAQRFSRVAVADIQLARPEAARAGREQNNLYMLFRGEIDKARETYRKQFMTIPSMVDYLHIELVNTAAKGNEDTLGMDYPGPLV